MRHKVKIFALLLLILSGCYPKEVKYNFGIGTRIIQGTFIKKNDDLLKSKAFIVIIEYFSSFIKLENELPIYVPKARLVFPDKKGHYQINFDLKAVSIDLAFIASGYKMHRFSFRRQIGVGNIKYDVQLIKSESWYDEFVIQTRPFLENFILEQRFKMPDSQQLFLGNWIASIKNKKNY